MDTNLQTLETHTLQYILYKFTKSRHLIYIRVSQKEILLDAIKQM